MTIDPPKERPFSTRTLSDRWECSGQHIRDMIAAGELRCFRIGSLIRIPYDEVMRIENSYSNSSPPAETARPFVPRIIKKPIRKA